MDRLLKRLDTIAERMNALQQSSSATPSYDLMAGAIWWSDERPEFDRAEDHWCLRPVLRYRTTLILDSPETRWLPFWERSLELFPSWPGFHLARTTPSPELVEFYQVHCKAALESLDRSGDSDA